MTSLEDLVTGNIPDPEPEEEQPLELLPPLLVRVNKPHVKDKDIIRICEALREEIAREPTRVPYAAAQLAAYLERHALYFGNWQGRRQLLVLFSLSATYSVDPSDDTRKDLLEWIDALENEVNFKQFAAQRQKIIGTPLAQIDFLQEFLGEELLDELVFISEVKRPTARRWIGGAGDPNWNSQQKIRLLARAFYAAERSGMSKEETLRWYRDPFGGGTSPRDKIRSFCSVINADLRAALDVIGFQGDNT